MSSKKSIGVTTSESSLPQKTTKDVPGLIDQLEKQLKELKGNIKDSISLDISTDHGVNIKDVTTVKKLLELSSSIRARHKAYNEEMEFYKLDPKVVSEFQVSDKSLNQWEQIFEKAIFELINKKRIKQLETAIEKLSHHLDSETKLAKELNSLMSLAEERID